VLGKRGTEAAYRRRIGAGGGAPRGVVGVLVAGVPEGGGEVARELLRNDVVLMVHLAGAKRRWIDGATARPSGGASSRSSAQWSGRSGARERNWAGWGAPVGHGGAVGALDRGWEAVAAAEVRRGGELGKRKSGANVGVGM
jgi:hypothetical protein